MTTFGGNPPHGDPGPPPARGRSGIIADPPHTGPVSAPPPHGPVAHPPHIVAPATVYEVSIGTFPPTTQRFTTVDQALGFVRSHFTARNHSVTITATQTAVS